jgi:hypothetical protein
MATTGEHMDKPEPRWQALLAFIAVGGIYLALPRSLIVGPTWLLPTLILVLLVPTVVAHRTGKRSLNRALGFLINAIITVALIGSVILLVTALPHVPLTTTLYVPASVALTLFKASVLLVWLLNGATPLYH